MTANPTDNTIPTNAADLTRHIETRFHARHREQLPVLADLAARVEAVHAHAEAVPAGLAALLSRLAADLDAHMRKEETILFPAIRSGGMPGIERPIAVMRADHDGHASEVSAIRKLTNDLAAPSDACGSWRRLYDGLDEFLTDLDAHMAIENEVLFPQFEAPPPSLHRGCACHGH